MPDKKRPLIFGVPGGDFYKTLNSKEVFVSELRPGLDGMKIVATDLLKAGIKPVIICDNMLGFCMSRGFVKEVHIFSNAITGKNAICRTGSLVAALMAHMHKVPVYLHKAQALNMKAKSLLEIDGINVGAKDIKTYVPVAERVPLRLVKGRVKNG